MALQKIFEQIRNNIDAVINKESTIGLALWHELLKQHPADIAQLFSYLNEDDAQQLFLHFPEHLQCSVFIEFSNIQKTFCLAFLNDTTKRDLLNSLPIDELTDFFDDLSNQELKEYLKLLHKNDREKVLSLLQFNPESAGGIMDMNVLSLMQDFTVEKSIQILQRLQPNRDLHQQIYITNEENQLTGHIRLEDLVLKSPQVRLASILRPNELVIHVDQDREEIAQQMIHYNLMIVPVTNHENIFLGVISSDTLVEVIEQEASEDIYRMAALSPIKNTYFETPFFKLLYQRGSILLILLVLQSFSSLILQKFQATLCGFLMFYITTLISTGGNTSSQTSALAIQGMATGEINDANRWRFIGREFLMSLLIATLLSVFSFIRIYATHHQLWGSLTVSLSLGIIIIVSVLLGSCMPLLLKKLNLDPAHSAGPLLATLMDIIGLLIYCGISYYIFA
ncbi:MAG: magnesium transporter [Candidatus Babeliaceae bacterium]|jgi:magnesium transporter